MSGKHRLLFVRKLRIFAENFSREIVTFFSDSFWVGGVSTNSFMKKLSEG